MAKQPFTASELRRQHRKLLMWPILLALLFGITGFGEILEDALRIGRNKVHMTPASGDIVLVQIGPKSLREEGNWPWPRKLQGELFRKAKDLGAKDIFVDILYFGPTTPTQDQALAEDLRDAGNITLAAQTRIGNRDGEGAGGLPIPALRAHAQTASVSVAYNWQLAVWSMPRHTKVDGIDLPTMSTLISGKAPNAGEAFPIDYSIDPDSIPVINASDLLRGRVARSVL